MVVCAKRSVSHVARPLPYSERHRDECFGGKQPSSQGTATPPDHSAEGAASKGGHRTDDTKTATKSSSCWSCGSTAHHRAACPYFVNDYKCRLQQARSQGNYVQVTRCHRGQTKGSTVSARGGVDAHQNVHATVSSDNEEDSLTLHVIKREVQVNSANINHVYSVSLKINGRAVHVELNTCAEASIASSAVYNELGKLCLEPAPRLHAYGGAAIPSLGQCIVDVEYNGVRKKLPLVVIVN